MPACLCVAGLRHVSHFFPVPIDCDTCRWMAPDFFRRRDMQSAVLRQPETEEERFEAFSALLSCPT